MSRQILGNREREETLTAMVKQYGEGNWSQIARALTIYGITLPRAIDLHGIWRQLKSSDVISIQEENDLIKFGVLARGRTTEFTIAWSEKYGKDRRIDQLPGLFNRKVRKGLLQLSVVFSRFKAAHRRFLMKLHYGSVKNFLTISDVVTTDPFVNEIVLSSKLICDLLIVFAYHQDDSRSTQYGLYSQITKRWQFELAVEHIKYVDALTKISSKYYSKEKDT